MNGRHYFHISVHFVCFRSYHYAKYNILSVFYLHYLPALHSVCISIMTIIRRKGPLRFLLFVWVCTRVSLDEMKVKFGACADRLQSIRPSFKWKLFRHRGQIWQKSWLQWAMFRRYRSTIFEISKPWTNWIEINISKSSNHGKLKCEPKWNDHLLSQWKNPVNILFFFYFNMLFYCIKGMSLLDYTSKIEGGQVTHSMSIPIFKFQTEMKPIIHRKGKIFQKQKNPLRLKFQTFF